MPSSLSWKHSVRVLVVLFGANVSPTTLLDSECICIPPENSCSQGLTQTPDGYRLEVPSPNRCHLNSSISTTSYTPSWVTPNVTALFDQTYQQAVNGSLGSDGLNGYWTASIACNFGGQAHWATSCDTYNNNGADLTGYASLGFHPFGAASGLWLTQILGPFGQEFVSGPDCPVMDFYVNITLINANTQVYELPLNAVAPELIGAFGNAATMTDNALLAAGLDMNCSNIHDVNYHHVQTPSQHVDCPSIHRTKTPDEMACEAPESVVRKCMAFNDICPNAGLLTNKNMAVSRYGEPDNWLLSTNFFFTSLYLSMYI